MNLWSYKDDIHSNLHAKYFPLLFPRKSLHNIPEIGVACYPYWKIHWDILAVHHISIWWLVLKKLLKHTFGDQSYVYGMYLILNLWLYKCHGCNWQRPMIRVIVWRGTGHEPSLEPIKNLNVDAVCCHWDTQCWAASTKKQNCRVWNHMIEYVSRLLHFI